MPYKYGTKEEFERLMDKARQEKDIDRKRGTLELALGCAEAIENEYIRKNNIILAKGYLKELEK